VTGGVALQAVVTGLSLGAVYGLVGLGFSLVWSLTRVLQLAHGDIVIGSALLAVLVVVGRTPVALSPGPGRSVALVLLALLFAAALSVVTYLVAVRPFLKGSARGAVLGWAAGTATAGLVLRTAVGVALPAAGYVVPDALHLDGLGGPLPLPGGGVLTPRTFAVLGIALTVAVAADRFLAQSATGRAMRAVADDVDAARLCGIAVERIVLVAFAVAGLLAGAAAVLVAPTGTVSIDGGVVLGLDGAAAALLGRLGSARGAVLGGLSLGVVQQLAVVTPHLGAGWSELVPLLALVVVLAARPEGLRAGRQVAVE
jgi:branched-subunit amino acid ABC-type transport system permease component